MCFYGVQFADLSSFAKMPTSGSIALIDRLVMIDYCQFLKLALSTTPYRMELVKPINTELRYL